jgi:hypothetical protein
MSDLVERLCQGRHKVVVSLRPERTVKALKESLDRGRVHVRFTETRGGTELGISIDRNRSNLGGADMNAGTGWIKLAGDLTLDFVRVRCFAEIDVASLEGEGWLEKIGMNEAVN